ncbi:MAG: hypothetical protein Q4A78_00120 [Peptostreptococcaceae bacterium]|nr:hypothetical protein [Peptostreptococcaceae bacterium]
MNSLDTKEKDILQTPPPKEDPPESENTPFAEKGTESSFETEKAEGTPDKLEHLGAQVGTRLALAFIVFLLFSITAPLSEKTTLQIDKEGQRLIFTHSEREGSVLSRSRRIRTVNYYFKKSLDSLSINDVWAVSVQFSSGSNPAIQVTGNQYYGIHIPTKSMPPEFASEIAEILDKHIDGNTSQEDWEKDLSYIEEQLNNKYRKWRTD